MATVSDVLLCRLCWETMPSKKATNIFSNVSMTQRWTDGLLDVIVSKEDELPAHVCNKCITRIKALERATTDLAAFKSQPWNVARVL